MSKLANYFLKSTCSIECENYKLPTWKSFAVYYTCFRISFNEMRLPFYFIGSKSPTYCFRTCYQWHMNQLHDTWLSSEYNHNPKERGLKDNSTNKFALVYNTSC
jgi:hypothetical protein